MEYQSHAILADLRKTSKTPQFRSSLFWAAKCYYYYYAFKNEV